MLLGLRERKFRDIFAPGSESYTHDFQLLVKQCQVDGRIAVPDLRLPSQLPSIWQVQRGRCVRTICPKSSRDSETPASQIPVR